MLYFRIYVFPNCQTDQVLFGFILSEVSFPQNMVMGGFKASSVFDRSVKFGTRKTHFLVKGFRVIMLFTGNWNDIP